jgi:hypothetical protein
MTFDEAVAALERRGSVYWTGDGSVRAQCPAHDDYHPSFSMTEGKSGRLLVRCFAGCSFEDIMAALEGKTTRSKATRPPEDTKVVKIIDYPLFDYDGNLIAIHERRENAKGEKVGMPWRMPDGMYTLDRQVADLPLYNGYLLKLCEPGSEVYLCEGERAADSIMKRDRMAVGTVCGANNTPSEAMLKILCPFRVTYWADLDPIGRLHMMRIRARVERLRKETRQ